MAFLWIWFLKTNKFACLDFYWIVRIFCQKQGLGRKEHGLMRDHLQVAALRLETISHRSEYSIDRWTTTVIVCRSQVICRHCSNRHCLFIVMENDHFNMSEANSWNKSAYFNVSVFPTIVTFFNVTENFLNESSESVNMESAGSELLPGYKMRKIVFSVTFPLLVILGTFGNVLSVIIMRSGSLKKVSTCFYMTLLGLADTGKSKY